jgi:uncharacterized DUF497 family protein
MSLSMEWTRKKRKGSSGKPGPPFPQQIGDDKLLVMGRGRGDRLLQVVYIFDPDNTVFIIHARPLNEHEKHRYRRKTQE